MQGFSLNITGGPELQRNFAALGPRTLSVAGAALYRSAEMIARDSKEKYVPVLTGALRNSIQAHPPESSGGSITVVISAGGAASAYAINVHETNKNYHNGRQWKYLETPMKAATNDILRELGESIKEALGI